MDFCPWHGDMMYPIVFDKSKLVWKSLFSYIQVVYSDMSLGTSSNKEPQTNLQEE